MVRKTSDEIMLFAKFCVENKDLAPSLFIRKALKVDLFRNKFSKNVLYQQFMYAKRVIKDSYRCKGMPLGLYNAVLSVIKKDALMDSIIEKQEENKIKIAKTYEDIACFYDNKMDSLQNKYEELIKQNNEKIATLQEENKATEAYFYYKNVELANERDKALREFF